MRPSLTTTSVIPVKIKAASRGFTFVELLVVIVIIGILSAIAIPQFRKTFDSFELDNFAKNTYYLSRYLQASAISQGKVYYLNINAQEGKFWATYKPEEQFKKVEGKFGNVFKAPGGITISLGEESRLVNQGIYFYPDGSSDEASIYFKNKNKEQRSLIIKGAVGEIKIK